MPIRLERLERAAFLQEDGAASKMMTSALRSAVREVLAVATRRTLTLAPTTQRWATTGHGTTEASSADEAAPSAESNVTIDGVLGLYAHNSPGTLAFFMSDRFEALPANVKVGSVGSHLNPHTRVDAAAWQPTPRTPQSYTPCAR